VLQECITNIYQARIATGNAVAYVCPSVCFRSVLGTSCRWSWTVACK